MSETWRTEFEIAWGDCDDAGIVFYPHFFRWMDTAFHRFLRARGTSHREVTARFGLIGLPIVEANARFVSPVSYDEALVIAVQVAEWQQRRCRVAYEGRRPDGTLVFEGHEVRAFAARDEARGKLRGVDVPAELKALLA